MLNSDLIIGMGIGHLIGIINVCVVIWFLNRKK